MSKKSYKSKMENFILKMFEELHPGYENYLINENGDIVWGNDSDEGQTMWVTDFVNDVILRQRFDKKDQSKL